MKTITPLLLLAACTDAASPPMTTPPPAGRAITGTAAFVLTDESGSASRYPIGLHDTLVSAQFSYGEGWNVFEGVSNGDGTFSITGVPEGDYWLEVYDVPTGSRQLLWTNADTLAFEERAAGRGDAVTAGPSTTLTLGPIDGLDPVQDTDGLQFVSGNLGFGGNLFGALSTSATTLQTSRTWTGLPLISAASGDDLILVQLRQQQDPTTGVSYLSAVRSATFDSIEQANGQDTVVTGSFTPPPALAYDLRWNRSEFDAMSGDIRPSRVGPVSSQNFLFRAQPGGTQFGTSPLTPVVLAPDLSAFTDASDLDLPFSITNPYPESWLFNDATLGYPVTLDVPGLAGATLELDVSLHTITNQIASATHPIQPLVSPPRSPTIEGADLFGDHDGVGLTPTIAWQKPSIGEPTAYIITIEQWELSVGNATFAPVASLVVPGDVTTVRLPSRLLEPGQHYLLQIAAYMQQGQDVRKHSLYELAVPSGFAPVITGNFSP